MQNEELREAQRSLEIALANYTALFDSAPIGYAALANDCTIRQINHAGSRLLGTRRERLIGTRFVDHILLSDRNKLERAIGRALNREEPAPCELEVIRPGGGRFNARAICAPLVGPQPAIMLAFEDITEQKAAERTLREADHRKDEFLATLSQHRLFLSRMARLAIRP